MKYLAHRPLLAFLLSVCLATPAFAGHLDYTFDLRWKGGSLDGTTSTGTLAFDSSLAVPNAEYFGADVLTRFDARVGSTVLDTSSVTVGFLTFDAYGDLRLLGVGTDCLPGGCSSTFRLPVSFYMVFDSQSELDRFFAVGGPPNMTQSLGVGELRMVPVPEPTTASLFGLGVIAILLLHRRVGVFRAS